MVEVKTIKVAAGCYASGYDFEPYDAIFLKGMRGAGKSYPVGRYISPALARGRKFIYMRLSPAEVSTADSWCGKNLDIPAIWPDASGDVVVRRGWPSAGDLYLQDSARTRRHIGRVKSLNAAANIKSGVFDDYDYIVFEEYSRRGMTVGAQREAVFNVLEDIKTVLRERAGKVFLISNSLQGIPLIERALPKEVEVIKNPVMYKLYLKGKKSKAAYARYMQGEAYEPRRVAVKPDEIYPVIASRGLIVFAHQVLDRWYYVRERASGDEAIEMTRYVSAGLLPFARNVDGCTVQFSTPRAEHLFVAALDALVADAISICARLRYTPSKLIVRAS